MAAERALSGRGSPGAREPGLDVWIPRAKEPGLGVGRARSGRGLSLRMAKQRSKRSAGNDVALARALALVRDLRARCPWDRAQTRATLRPYLVEEALELDRALADGEPTALRDELGDLLLHLAFQIAI